MHGVISFSNYMLKVLTLCFYILVPFLRCSTGAAVFKKHPPSVLYVQTGQTARFLWNYTVGNRNEEFRLNSPLWAFYDSNSTRSIIGTEDGLNGWKWALHQKCPARLKTRVSKESTATLVISNVTTADNGTYGCSLVLNGLPDKTSKVQLIVTAQELSNPSDIQESHSDISSQPDVNMADVREQELQDDQEDPKKNRQSHDHCCVPQCTSDARYDNTLSFHRIPSNEAQRKEWIVKIRRDVGENFQITGNTKVCSKHFKPEDFTGKDKAGRTLLKRGSTPSIFAWAPLKVRRQLVRVVESGPEHAVQEEQTAVCLETDICESADDTAGTSAEALALIQTRAELEEARREIEKLKLEAEQFREEGRRQMEKFKMAAEHDIKKAKDETYQLRSELEMQLFLNKHSEASLTFGLERFSNDKELIKFYTGFPSYAHVIQFFKFIEPNAQNMTYCYASGVGESRPGQRNISLIDDMFLFLVRVKVGLYIQDLSIRFNLHMSTISRKLTTWANFLYFVLSNQSIWPSRTQIDLFMPEECKKCYPSTRVILDCTEIYVQTPSSLLLQSHYTLLIRVTILSKGL